MTKLSDDTNERVPLRVINASDLELGGVETAEEYLSTLSPEQQEIERDKIRSAVEAANNLTMRQVWGLFNWHIRFPVPFTNRCFEFYIEGDIHYLEGRIGFWSRVEDEDYKDCNWILEFPQLNIWGKKAKESQNETI